MANCWGTNSFCGPSNPDRYIKLWENKVIAVEGSKIVNSLDLCGLRIPYVNQQTNTYLIKAGQTGQVISWDSVGTDATMILVSPQYDKEAVEKGTSNYIIWSFIDENDNYPMKQILWLTGDSALPLKNIKVTNPSSYDVRLNVMVVGLEGSNNANPSSQVVSNMSFNNLNISQIKTWSSDSIYVENTATNQAELYIQVDRIGALERSGRFVTIDDDSIGDIILGMTNDDEAKQLISSLNYLVNNKDEHGTDFVLPQTSDLAAPVLTWTPAVTEPTPSVFTTNMFLSGYTGTINKQDIIDHAVTSIMDVRDGSIIANSGDVAISDGVTSYTSITALGSYIVNITTSDLAENTQLYTLQLEVLA